MTLEVLPIEIFNLILVEVKHTIPFEELCQLRLVSRTFAGAIDPLVFKSVTLAPRLNPKHPRLIQHLVSAENPNSRWTTALSVDQNAPVNWPPSSEDRSGVEPEDDNLISAIETLQSVKFASLRLYTRFPFEGIVSALSRLPALDALDISFAYDTRSIRPDAVLPPCRFPKLRALRVNGMKLAPSIVASLKDFVAKNEELSRLTLVWDRSSTVEDEVRVLPAPLNEYLPPSLQFLTSLTIHADRIPLSARCAVVFPSLSHLAIENAIAGNIDPSFWDALQQRGVQLKSLSIYPLTQPIIRYLESYSGLVKLRLAPAYYGRRKAIKDDVSNKAFNAALTMHRGTLRHLAYEQMSWRKYGITEERLQVIPECKKLETLWLAYHFPSEVNEDYGDFEDDDEPRDRSEDEDEVPLGSPSNMNLTVLLSNLASNLPHLSHLTLEARRTIPNLGWCGNAYISYEDAMARAFEKAVLDAKDTAQSGELGGSSCVHEALNKLQITCLPSYGYWFSRAAKRRK